MAVDDRLPAIAPLSATSTSSSSSTRQRIQVATDNSSTFIQFPTNVRQSSVYVPTNRSRTSLSATRPVLSILDTHVVSSNKTKSNASRSSVVSADHERNHSQPRFNPILNNPLLNHRKEQPKSSPTKVSVNFSQTTRLFLPSNDNQISTMCANTTSLLVHEKENNISNKQSISDDHENNDQQEIHSLDKSKFDYITRWLYGVQQAASSSRGTFSRTKRSKNKSVQS